ncbi:conserved hypothetical protein [Verticillium alfalfae VaMs.102]|uniref:Uncharacterized protein n=1 Tax=Verticillium alfalfae (strain VaMs.102 / ATCC MYA-4576 / FGSC 10136) TaxID=526221 RepID=C9STU1_VERA1|nr:conserved hypothetical protein [Verticillium alfalfae VaMs.102]EEY22252.1 conserved hypothetical protein [Verticillium alfalfae VaMs.102]
MAYMPPPALPRLTTAKGKVAELRLELNSGGKKDKNNAGKKIALKKIVANMTMSNNDMVALFPRYYWMHAHSEPRDQEDVLSCF